MGSRPAMSDYTGQIGLFSGPGKAKKVVGHPLIRASNGSESDPESTVLLLP